jgi:hypothetical protein
VTDRVRAKRLLPPAGNGEATSFPFGDNAPPGPEPVYAETAPGPPADTTEAPEAPPEAPGRPDPFDQSTYRKHRTLTGASNVKQVLTDIPVRTPDSGWWCRVRPGEEYAFFAWVLEVPAAEGIGKDMYLLPDESLADQLIGVEPKCVFKSFHLATTKQGKVFIWPVRRHNDPKKPPEKWMRAPHEAIRRAVDTWVRLAWVAETREHKLMTAELAYEPQWPDITMRQAMSLGFGDNVIWDANHAAIRDLQGK